MNVVGMFLGARRRTVSGPVDATAPTVLSADIYASNPDRLVVVYSEAVSSTTTGLSTAGGGNPTIASVVSGSGTDTVTYLLSAIPLSTSITFAYASAGVEDLAGNDLDDGSTVITVEDGVVTPATILDGAVYWWSALAGVDPGTESEIDELADQGGNGVPLTGVTTTRPSYVLDDGDTYPAIIHNSDYLRDTDASIPTIGTGDFVVAAVWRVTSGAISTLYSDLSAGQFLAIETFGANVQARIQTSGGTDGALTIAPNAALKDWNSIVIRRVSGVLYASVNGGAEVSKSNATTAGTLTINEIVNGALIAGATVYGSLVGGSRELILWQETTDTTQVAALHEFFANRYTMATDTVLSLDVAEGITLAGSDVASWEDRRGSGITLSHASTRPIVEANGDGLDQVTFAGGGSNDRLDYLGGSVVDLESDFTICGVMECSSAGSRYTMMIGSQANANHGMYLLGSATAGTVTLLQFNLVNDAATTAGANHGITAPAAGDLWIPFMARRRGTRLSLQTPYGAPAEGTAPSSPISADAFGLGGLLYWGSPASYNTAWAALDVYDFAVSDLDWSMTILPGYQNRFARIL